MAIDTKTSGEGNINLIDKIVGGAEIFSVLLILIIFISTPFSLFLTDILQLEKNLDNFLSIIFVIGMVSIIPTGLFLFLTQVFRIIRRKRRPLTFFNFLMLVGSVATVLLGIIAFMGVYVIVG